MNRLRMGLAALLLALLCSLPALAPPARADNSCGFKENTKDTTASGQLQALCDLRQGSGYRLADNIDIASGAFSTPVTGIAAGTYIVEIDATAFNGATIQVQGLGNKAVWRDATGISGTAYTKTSMVVGTNGTLRLKITGGSPTGVVVTLS